MARCIRSHALQTVLYGSALRTRGHPHAAQLRRPIFAAARPPGSPRNNEAWAAPAASFAYLRGLANGLRRGFGTQCCHRRARVCARVTAAVAVAVAVAVGGRPGGAQPRGDRPRRPLPLRIAAEWPGRVQGPAAPAAAPSRCRWRG